MTRTRTRPRTPTRRATLRHADQAEAGTSQELPLPVQVAAPQHWAERRPAAHRVQFYETDAFLLEAASEFIGAGLDAGAVCLVFATPAHREGLAQRLQGNGFDLTRAEAQGDYVALDAAETLAQFLLEGSPEPQHFAQVVGGLIERAAKGKRGVRVFGEMVALLWEQGNQEAALRLEALWNALGSGIHPFTLLCAYPISLFVASAHTDLFTQMCALHSQVIPDESYTQLASQEEQLRAVSLFRQKAVSLAAEMAERQVAEERLRRSENRYRRLFETATDGILLVEPGSARITDANAALLHLLGSSHEQVIGRTLWQVGLLPDEPTAQAFLRQVRQERVLRQERMYLATTTGEPCLVEWISTLFQASGYDSGDGDGDDVLQCTLRDVTDRRPAEEARLYPAPLVSPSDVAILSKDLNGNVPTLNAAVERMYGYLT